ncbi:FAD-dependent oxidoreductase [Bacillus sp. ISL-55]|uniref:flavin monoamine oxidase family protein n=1 Tax=Bacillus sp. ISL-55 TaxID=2819134 RepID=UPI001BE5D44E|nr:FAD-dependent oxidoreductase [Bacillus sp. ISL-55]MBT2692814.1 FAD-dependent oxidoreductase [Bacillus sp. ISL-55]
MKEQVVIVGAGLSGLRAASLLQSKGISCKVLEARNRIGGRVLSMAAKDMPELGRFDLGPTWFWPNHELAITKLVKDLGLPTIEQHTRGAMLFEQSQTGQVQRHVLPEGAVERSVRLAGGIQSLIGALVSSLPSETVLLNTRVNAIQLDQSGGVTIEAEQADGKKKSIRAAAVILALPPRIVVERIAFSPALPDGLIAGLKDKPTWMAGQAKAVAVYERTFWRDAGLSGQVTSWAGPLQEIHDASPETGYGALFGFFGIPSKMRQELGEEQILRQVTDQLTRLFGPQAGKPLALLYKDWASDPETAVEEDAQPLTSFPEYGLPAGKSSWEKRVIFAGTETASGHGGHLEGALQAAERAVSIVMESVKNNLL